MERKWQLHRCYFRSGSHIFFLKMVTFPFPVYDSPCFNDWQNYWSVLWSFPCRISLTKTVVVYILIHCMQMLPSNNLVYSQSDIPHDTHDSTSIVKWACVSFNRSLELLLLRWIWTFVLLCPDVLLSWINQADAAVCFSELLQKSWCHQYNAHSGLEDNLIRRTVG